MPADPPAESMETLPDGSPFKRLQATQVQKDLITLLQRIACEKGRVEILGEDGVCTTVLVSKDELDGLERALDILSNTDGVRAMSDTIAQFAVVCEPASA